MKTGKLWMAIGGLLLIGACSRPEDKAIAGVYATQFSNEYTRTNDTIIITAFNLSAHTYQVERRSGFNKIRDGQVLPREYKQQKWTATYVKEHQVLEEDELGRKLYFNPDQHQLLLGRASYLLIKQL